ncbi:MAG: hypothetical protein WEA61_10435 [Anaerolineales bacterium]
MQKDGKRFPDSTFSLEAFLRQHPEQDVSNADLTAEDTGQDPDPAAEGEMLAEETAEPLAVTSAKRLGIHYFADTEHYSQADLERWLPVLQALGVNWITLPAPLDRAIPSEFIGALIESEIQPVVHLNLPLTQTLPVDDFAPILRAYASWGVRYIVLFDRPNLRAQWPGMAWTQRGLVNRFLDAFIPLANAASQAGLIPVFPALEPGGDYWDTAFLRSALETLAERSEGLLLGSLALGAYAWTGDNSMTWGAGGPENWPATLPYHTPDGSEDQRGFRIFDWYNAISRAAIGRELPIILVAAGVQCESSKPLDAQAGTRAVKMAETFLRAPSEDKNNAVPANVLACNFWLLAVQPEDPAAHSAWFKINGKPSKVGEAWLAWRNPGQKKSIEQPARNEKSTGPTQAIHHYLLLPATQNCPMDAVRTFLQEHQATVGTSETEAAQAARVTLAGGMESFSDELIRNLIRAGCTIDHIQLAGA